MNTMNDNHTAQIVPSNPSLMSRVMKNETARKSLAGAAAGVLIALVSELIWPSES